jgi:hypothetical protein
VREWKPICLHSRQLKLRDTQTSDSTFSISKFDWRYNWHNAMEVWTHVFTDLKQRVPPTCLHCLVLSGHSGCCCCGGHCCCCCESLSFFHNKTRRPNFFTKSKHTIRFQCFRAIHPNDDFDRLDLRQVHMILEPLRFFFYLQLKARTTLLWALICRTCGNCLTQDDNPGLWFNDQDRPRFDILDSEHPIYFQWYQ